MASKEFSVEYEDRDWLNIEKLGLTPEDEQEIVVNDMFREAFLDLKIEVIAQTNDKELDKSAKKDLQSIVKLTAEAARTRIQKTAGGAFADVVKAWRAEQNPDLASGTEAKQAIASVKKLEEALKRLLTDLPRDMRGAAGKALKMSADDFITINKSDYEVRLRTDLLAGLEDNKTEELAKEHDEKLKRLLANKGKWMWCAVAWLSKDQGRLKVSKKTEIKPTELKSEGTLLDESKIPRKFWGKVYSTGSKLYFEFLTKPPGGSATEPALKNIIKRQLKKSYTIQVDCNLPDYTNTPYLTEKDEPANKSKEESQASTKKGRSEKGSEETSKRSSLQNKLARLTKKVK